jgi:hypothetical protein
MKSVNKIRIIAALLAILVGGSYVLFAQGTATYTVDQTGSNPTFKNDSNAVFRIKSGYIKNMHDSIGGKVEFIRKEKDQEFAIPNSIYRKLSIIGPADKKIDYRVGKEGLNLIVLDSLFIRDTFEFKRVNFEVRGIDIDAKGNLISDANMTGELNSYFNMNQDSFPQTLESRIGSFDRLRIDNPYGVELTDSTKFDIKRVLELKRGELRNNNKANFKLSDSSIIRRYSTGSVAQAPEFSEKVSVYYEGNDNLPIIAGPEIPRDPAILQDLYQRNTGGLYLDTMAMLVTVNDTLYVGRFINTNRYDSFGKMIDSSVVLVSTSGRDPIFDDKYTWAEITGNFRHTNLDRTVTDTLRYNNPYTWIKFETQDDITGIKDLTVRAQPIEFPYYDNGQNKIKRYFKINANDLNNIEKQDVTNMTFGYGWRHDNGNINSPNYETNDKDPAQVVLQRWDNTNWYEYKTDKDDPKLNSDGTWAYGVTRNIERLGFFAMGVPGDGIPLVLKALVYLEGPYIGNNKMTTELSDRKLIPLTPPDMYPYNLDTNRLKTKVSSIPEGVVDWIVLQFSNEKGIDTLYRTCFLKSTGEIVETDGLSPVSLGKGNIDTGYYYISVRHRNHINICTAKPIYIKRDSTDMNSVKDFSDPNFVDEGLGKYLKPIKNNNGYIYVMIAGESNKNIGDYDKIDYENDILKAWASRNKMGHDGSLDNYNAYNTFLIYDYDMNGIITTKDLNLGWNNRDKVSKKK